MANCNAWSCKTGRTSDVADDRRPPPRPCTAGSRWTKRTRSSSAGRGRSAQGPAVSQPFLTQAFLSTPARRSRKRAAASARKSGVHSGRQVLPRAPIGAAPLRSAAGASSSPRPRCVDSTTRTAHYESFAVSGTGCNVRGPRARSSTCSTSGPWPVRPGQI